MPWYWSINFACFLLWLLHQGHMPCVQSPPWLPYILNISFKANVALVHITMYWNSWYSYLASFASYCLVELIASHYVVVFEHHTCPPMHCLLLHNVQFPCGRHIVSAFWYKTLFPKKLRVVLQGSGWGSGCPHFFKPLQFFGLSSIAMEEEIEEEETSTMWLQQWNMYHNLKPRAQPTRYHHFHKPRVCGAWPLHKIWYLVLD